MAVVFDANGQDFVASASYSGTPITVGSGSNRALLVWVIFYFGSGSPTATVTWNGVSLTPIGSPFNDPSLSAWVQLYGLTNPASGAKTLAVTATAGSPADIEVDCVSVVGASQTGGTTTFYNLTTATSATGTALSVTVTSATNDLVIGEFITDGFSSTGNTNTFLGGPAGLTAGNRAAGAASVTLTATGVSSGHWDALGVAIKAIPSAGASYAGSGQLVASAARLQPASSLLSAAGLLAANTIPEQIVSAIPLLAGVGSLATNANPPIDFVGDEFDGASTLVSSSYLLAATSTILQGAGSLTANALPQQIIGSVPTLGGIGAQTADTQPPQIFAVPAIVAAIGAIGGQPEDTWSSVEKSSTLTLGGSNLTATGDNGSAVINYGVGSFVEAVPSGFLAWRSPFVGVGTSLLVAGVATLAGSGFLSAGVSTATDNVFPQLIPGAGSLTAIALPQQIVGSIPALGGTGAVSANVSPPQFFGVPDIMAGAGSLAAATIQYGAVRDAISGAGTLATDSLVARAAVPQRLQATGALTAGAIPPNQIVAGLPIYGGLGHLAVNASSPQNYGIPDIVAGTGSLAGALSPLLAASALLAGSGALASDSVVPIHTATQALNGTGGLLADAKPFSFALDALGGSGGLHASAILHIRLAHKFVGVSGAALYAQATPRVTHNDPSIVGSETMITGELNDSHQIFLEPGTLVGLPPGGAVSGTAEIVTPQAPMIWLPNGGLTVDFSSIQQQLLVINGLLKGLGSPLIQTLPSTGSLVCNATGGHAWGTPVSLGTASGTIAPSASLTITVGASVPTGALIYVSAYNLSTNTSGDTYSDSKSNSYSTPGVSGMEISPTATSADGVLSVSYAYNVTALVSGVDTISVENLGTGSSSVMMMSAFYIPGVHTGSNPLDGFATSFGAGGAVSSSLTDTSSSTTDLFVASLVVNAALSSDTFTQPAGFWQNFPAKVNVSGTGTIARGLIVPSAASKSWAPTITGRDWGVIIAAFKQAP